MTIPMIAAAAGLVAATMVIQSTPQAVPPPIANPAYAQGRGPVVVIDEAHKNTHTYASAPFRGLVDLLTRDGYRVRPLSQSLDTASLKGVDVLIVCNPGGWEGPEFSLTAAEVSTLVQWVRDGGALLYVLDHMPGPRHAARLSEALGITQWHDGYAMVDVPDALPVGNIIFWRREFLPDGAPSIGPTGPAGGTGYQGPDAVLAKHPITEGRGQDGQVRRIATFVGSAYQPPANATSLMTLPERAVSLVSKTPGAPDVRVDSVRTPVGKWSQGAALTIGRGRIAVFGEAGLLSAGPAADNRQFVLNVMHWLSRLN